MEYLDTTCVNCDRPSDEPPIWFCKQCANVVREALITSNLRREDYNGIVRRRRTVLAQVKSHVRYKNKETAKKKFSPVV